MRRTLVATAATVSLLTPITVVAVASPASAARTYQYVLHEKNESETFTEPGLCDPGPATIELSGVNEVVKFSSTQAGLTEEQAEHLFETGDPSITKFTYTETGRFVVTEADGNVYTGRFTFWVGGSMDGGTDTFTATFSLTGTSATGSHIVGHFVGHTVLRDGEVVHDFGPEGKGEVKGCPVPA